MDVALFDFDLPAHLISQEPAARRDGARLLILPPVQGPVRHARFTDLPATLAPGDLVVVNDARVMAARLRGAKASGGRVEVLLLRPVPGRDDESLWLCLVGASKRPRVGQTWTIDGGISATLVEDGQRGEAILRFRRPDGAAPEMRAFMERHGEMPLPPYIRREPSDPRAVTDKERYQTVFARAAGAVAAPTAGLHFTPEVIEALSARGVEIASLTLDVGPGTFRPVTAERAEDHVLDPESFHLPEATVESVTRTRQRGGRVVACGTTVVRVLESRVAADGELSAGAGECALYIRPGHQFRAVNGLLTNFHLPRSTLLMLVAALAGRERVLDAYREAIASGYRFYSYGDAMLVAPRRFA